MNNSKEPEWTTLIEPKSSIFKLNLKDLWEYRDLVMLFIKRDLTAQYKQTLLGPLWFFLQPLMTTFVFVVIFGKIAKLPTDGIPRVLFYMSGIVMWNYFSSCVNQTSSTFIANAGIFGKVYFPRLAVPLSQVISNLARFLIQFMMFAVILAYFFIKGMDFSINIVALFTPILILHMAVLGLSVGMIVSSLTTKYRDLTFLIGFGMQLWMYITPIVYPLSLVPEKWQTIYMLNPVVPILQMFKYGFLSSGEANWFQYAVSAGGTGILFLLGLVIFNSVEKTFIDRV